MPNSNINNNSIENLSFILQLISLELLFKDYNNSDLMRELQKQDNQYFEKLIKQNTEILKILKNKEGESN